MRVQVNLSDELVGKVDYYSKKMGVSRSALCSVLIGNGIMSYDQSVEMISSLAEKLSNVESLNIPKP